MDQKFALGILGLGVMGRSLALNFQRNGYEPYGYDIAPKLPEGFPVSVTNSLAELASKLAKPAIYFLMVPAGEPVDQALASLTPYLNEGDIVIDGGNSFFADTNRRVKATETADYRFIGMGVSGGEEGALWGPSLMPGGTQGAWEYVAPMFKAIAAKTKDGTPCVDWIGPEGSGHYVKMVHNGIEYGDMQLIAEIYDLLHRGAGLSNSRLSEVFADWNKRELSSYLIEITAEILKKEDDLTDGYLVDMILDQAGQKGTGKWASQNAFDVGAAIPTINSAVEARLVSAIKTERVAASTQLGQPTLFTGDVEALIKAAEQALYASKIVSYAQGITLLKTASKEYNWDLKIGSIVRLWRAGCIIRAELLQDIASAYDRDPGLSNLMLDASFRQALLEREAAWRFVAGSGISLGIPMLATNASLAYFDAYRSAVLPANLTQAQRDYFGAHTYKRTDRDGTFHTQWF